MSKLIIRMGDEKWLRKIQRVKIITLKAIIAWIVILVMQIQIIWIQIQIKTA